MNIKGFGLIVLFVFSISYSYCVTTVITKDVRVVTKKSFAQIQNVKNVKGKTVGTVKYNNK